VPSFTVDGSVLFQDPTTGQVRVLVPTARAPIRYRGTIESEVTLAPVVGATMRLRSEDVFDEMTGVVGTYQTTVESGADGVFDAFVLPGTYNVVITPPGNELGVLTETVIIVPPAGHDELLGQSFQLPPGFRYGGSVQASDGMRLANAVITASPRLLAEAAEMLGPTALHSRPSQATTDATGNYTLRLDVGLYDLTVAPPGGSRLPWIVRRDQPIGGSREPYTRDFEFPYSVPIRGTAMHTGEIPAASAEVRAFGVVHMDDGTLRTVLIGSATADADGGFSILAPPSY
jgi:hypothetical protein